MWQTSVLWHLSVRTSTGFPATWAPLLDQSVGNLSMWHILAKRLFKTSYTRQLDHIGQTSQAKSSTGHQWPCCQFTDFPSSDHLWQVLMSTNREDPKKAAVLIVSDPVSYYNFSFLLQYLTLLNLPFLSKSTLSSHLLHICTSLTGGQ